MNTTLSPITKERPDDDSLMIMIVMMTNNHSNRLAASSSRKFKMLLNTKCALLSAGHFFFIISLSLYRILCCWLFGFVRLCCGAMVCCLLCKLFGFVSRTTFTCAYKTHLLEYFSCLLYRPGSVYGCFNDKSSKHYDRSESKTPFRVRHRNI